VEAKLQQIAIASQENCKPWPIMLGFTVESMIAISIEAI
jgi:hypothetical protein